MDFVTPDGKPWVAPTFTVDATEAQDRPVRVRFRRAAKESRGFMVYGVKPGEECTRRACPRPYILRAAAEQCAGLLRKAGWREVVVSELLFG